MEKFCKLLFLFGLMGLGASAQNLNLSIISDLKHTYTARGDKARMIRSIPVGGIRNLPDGGISVITEIHGLIINTDSLGVEVSRTYKPLNYLQPDNLFVYDKSLVDVIFGQLGISIISGQDSYTDKMKIIYQLLLIQETETATDAQGNDTGLFGGDNFEIYTPPILP